MRWPSFSRFLVCLLGAAILSWTALVARAAGPHYVFAHYCVWYADYGATIQGYERDIMDAQSAGIDGFALDLGAYDDPKQSYYNTNVSLIYTAAEALGTGFKLFFSVDQSYLTNSATIVDLISTYADRPNTFLQGTNVVVSAYGGQNTDWQNGVFAPLSKSGISVFFVPFLWPNPVEELPMYSGCVNLLNSYSNILSGLFLFGAAGLPYQLAQCNSNYNQAVHAAGKIFMAGVSPSYWGCAQPKDGRRYFEDDGGEGTVAQWESIIANQPDWVEIVTWNDFLEGTYVSPINDPGQYEPQEVTPHRYCHAGYLDLAKHYIAWYKTGVEPPIIDDALYYFYRIHSTNLVASKDIQITQFNGDVADVVYNTLFLTAPARLQVISGI